MLGASLGATVALEILTNPPADVAAAALINPAIRARSVVPLLPVPYTWTPAASAAADHLDFITRAPELSATPLLIISGAQDHPTFRTDATTLAATLPTAELVEIPNLAHPLADEPGLHPAPQLPQTKAVDQALTEWFAKHL